ncbi:HAMP domain-containing protein [Salininema proteolyticum]|uniref:histidine kinase n=1 Tax=Salininema proteolyticum TaxID=1607685 RepID=A0ABV8TSU2_9ACTN
MRKRLTLLVTATAVLVLLAFIVPLIPLLRSASVDRTMNQAHDEATSLIPTIVTADKATVTSAVALSNRDSRFPVTVFWPDGEVIGIPAEENDAVRLAATGRSFSADMPGGSEVLYGIGTHDGGTAVVRTFVEDAEMTEGLGRQYLLVGSAAVLLLFVGAALARWTTNRILAPLQAVTDVSNRIAAGDTDARADIGDKTEVGDVARALNGLADRVDDLLAAERDRVADISHRLRTPLTVLKLEVEGMADDRERGEVEAAVAELEEAVTGVVNDARRPAGSGPVCDITALVRERIAFWEVLAEETGRRVGSFLPGEAIPVGVEESEARDAMDAALGNVFAHTPDGTGFSVRLERTADGALVTVVDEGPGISDPSLLERGRSAAGSSGLGIDIIRRTAVKSGGRAEFGPGPGGRGWAVSLHLSAGG